MYSIDFDLLKMYVTYWFESIKIWFILIVIYWLNHLKCILLISIYWKIFFKMINAKKKITKNTYGLIFRIQNYFKLFWPQEI